MKTKLFLAAVCAATLAGCTTPRARMDIADLNHYKIDCSRGEEQRAWLLGMMPTVTEQRANQIAMTSMLGWINATANGTIKEDRALFNGEQAATARTLIHQIDMFCPTSRDNPANKPKTKQGCVNVNETFTSGSSQGAVCTQKSKTNPATQQTRWEAIVDSQ